MSRRASVPGPLRRLGREPVRLVAVLLLGAVALAAAGIQAGAALALRASLDASWRGLYDILVLPAGTELPEAGLPPNTLNGSGTGLTFDDLAAVRGVAGVDVAAPIGEIVVPHLKYDSPKMTIPRDLVESFDSPQAYRLAVEYTTDDGLGERFVHASELQIIVDGTGRDEPPPPCTVSGTIGWGPYEASADEYPALASAMCFRSFDQGNGVYQFMGSGLGYTPAASETSPLTVYLDGFSGGIAGATRITLVDPVAERALLGDAGAFLDDLIAFGPGGIAATDAMVAWAHGDGGAFAEDFIARKAAEDAWAAPQNDAAVLAELRRLWTVNGDDYDTWLLEQQGLATYFPIVVAGAGAAVAPLGVRVSVEALGPLRVESVGEGFGSEIPAFPTGPGEPLGTVIADISDLLNPFIADPTAIAWPGTQPIEPNPRDAYATQYLTTVGRADAAAYDLSGDTPELRAAGFADPQQIANVYSGGSSFSLVRDGARPGLESAYASVSRVPTGNEPFGYPVVPVGTFDPAAIADAGAVDFVPLGAYESIGSTIESGEHAGAELAPSVSGLGLVSPRTVAIAPIAAATAWGQEDPVNAIRVRVGGIAGYSADAQQRVVATAAAIEALGYRAVVVAGSSPTDVTVEVDDYAFGVASPDDRQRVGTLGAVTQHWSELGAAARADVAISTSSVALLGLALLSAILLLIAAQFAAIPVRRERAAVMRAVGFSRMRIAGWIAGEEALGLVTLAIAGGAAVLLSGATSLALAASTAAAGTVLLLAAIAIVVGSGGRPAGRRRRAGRRRGDRDSADSVAAFGARQALVHPLAAATHGTAIVLVGLAAAGFAGA
ncbi:MAG: hypothetical protein J7480_09780, partial [Microbacteriaceae bacterium]|nr:hypothetical protein [Microbacteriaceae bacterium]